MDPFTAATSGFAVISLAIQLFENVREIKTFISNISEAQKTLQGIIDKLEQLELVLGTIKVIIEKQRRANGGEETTISASVLRAMESCKKTLQMLDDVLQNTKSASEGKGNRQKMVGAFKFALKRERIESYEQQLERVFQILNVTITLNLTDLHAQSSTKIQNEVRTTISNEFSFLRTDLVELSKIRNQREEGSDEIITRTRSRYKPKKTSHQLSRRQTRTTSTYQTMFGTFYYRNQSTFFNLAREQNRTAVKALVQTESSFGFIPTFNAFCVEFYRRNMCGSVSRGIRTYDALDPSHPVFDMCSDGDLIGLQACFNDYNISPLIVSGSTGKSLLHIAAGEGQLEVCSMLLRLGVWKENLLDNEGQYAESNSSRGELSLTLFPSDPLWYHHHYGPHHWNDPNGLLLLFASRQIDIVEASPGLIFWKALPPSDLMNIVDQWVTEENINIFEDSPLVGALRSMLPIDYIDPTPEDLSRCTLILRRLIKMGGDIHRFCTELGTSLLDEIIGATICPFEFRFLVDRWTHTLASLGIDIQSYVEAEMAFRPLPHQRSLPTINDRQRILFFSPTSYIPIWWDWHIPNDSPAHELLEEFKHFGPPVHACIPHEQYYYRWGEVDNAPFDYPFWLLHTLKFEWDIHLGRPTSDTDEAVMSGRMRRFEWKVEKKLRGKKGKKDGELRSMPGAWID